MGQTNFNGTWQGLLFPAGQQKDKSIIFYLNIEKSTEIISGKCREEYVSTDQLVIKPIKGTRKKNDLSLTQGAIELSKNTGNKNFCPIEIILSYIDSTGYLKGTYKSPTCRSVSGTVILFRSSVAFTNQDQPLTPHYWRNRFLLDLEKGYPAPEIRKKERDEFIFQPVYFSYDSAVLDQKYIPYLKKLARVIDGHSDLRIKVTGHTDSDGSTGYNDELSLKRAKSIIDFFKTQGVDSSRIEIEFKGESQPIDSNATEEGKQRNRRVEFSFI